MAIYSKGCAITDILVVDDEAAIVELLVDVLNNAGYRVCSALSGVQAIRVVETQRPTLVILDYAMPGMSGAEVLAYLRANGFPDLPVVMMSAGTRAGVEHIPGATGFLAKPFDFAALLKLAQHYAQPDRLR